MPSACSTVAASSTWPALRRDRRTIRHRRAHRAGCAGRRVADPHHGCPGAPLRRHDRRRREGPDDAWNRRIPPDRLDAFTDDSGRRAAFTPDRAVAPHSRGLGQTVRPGGRARDSRPAGLTGLAERGHFRHSPAPRRTGGRCSLRGGRHPGRRPGPAEDLRRAAGRPEGAGPPRRRRSPPLRVSCHGRSGSRTLRADAAPLVAVSIIQFLWGDLGWRCGAAARTDGRAGSGDPSKEG